MHDTPLPFRLRRKSQELNIGPGERVTITEEEMSGMARLEGGELTLQVRLAREVMRVTDSGVRTESDSEPIREVVVPLGLLESVRLRRGFWRPQLVLTARDLRAFEALGGVASGRPGVLTLDIARRDRAAARELASLLELALADGLLQRAEQSVATPELPKAKHPL